MSDIILYDYWRSSSSYRLRVALNLLALDYKTVPVNLLDQEQKSVEHLTRNPQGFVPVLEIDGQLFTQSLAILDYLQVTRGLFLYPDEPIERAKITALAHVLAVDVHPICNLGVLTQLTNIVPGRENVREDWMRHFISKGLQAFEALLVGIEPAPFIGGSNPGLAEICLIPQLYNADRWNVDYSNCHKIVAISDACKALDAFAKASPDNVHIG
ncbi:maleylacetoacetate isomerase [Marinomonas sp. CT5]|uniref:maleylacetoacetate isomerase n=1 Tax=Marinomonas sp. CT5 TaxID=2066133 RepID=UPI001BAEB844|nr:maleylacetoacetate isomerase [Marinomonas sp. CT5]QUX93927.1 maleylacetoacetate isomerase [Marinomonas sp. CT5]